MAEPDALRIEELQRGFGRETRVLVTRMDGGPVSAEDPSDIAMILDTDIGGDPDDAVALMLAAGLVPELALVVTSDEVDGQRARFARYLLDLAGRPEVPVVSGRELNADAALCVDGLTPPSVGVVATDVAAAVADVCAEAPVRCGGSASVHYPMWLIWPGTGRSWSRCSTSR